MKVPHYLIPKVNSREDIVLKYFKERFPKEWRGIITYNGFSGNYELTFDWVNHEDKHFAVMFALPDLEKKFEKPPDRYAQGVMALAKMPDYVPELTQETKDHFDKMITDALTSAKERDGTFR